MPDWKIKYLVKQAQRAKAVEEFNRKAQEGADKAGPTLS